MNPNEQHVCAALLEQTAEVFGQHGCNDFLLPNLPENWQLMQQLEEWNSGGRETLPQEPPSDKALNFPDYALMHYFADRLRQEADAHTLSLAELKETLLGVVSAFWERDCFAKHPISLEEAQEHAVGLRDALTRKPWADGKHDGDCTGVASPCLRCQVEAFTEQAQLLLDSLVACGIIASKVEKPKCP